MRRRPQRNPRRGILRATAAVVVLVILLFLAILITSSLTAPPATAPTAPPTPGPISTPTRQTPTPTSKPARAKPTPTKTKRTAAIDLRTQQPLRDTRGNLPTFAGQRADRTGESVSADGRLAAYFLRRGDAYSRNPLVVEQTATHLRTKLGYGDPLVRPVWSPDGRSLLYVRVKETRAFPGARWSLVRLDRESGRSAVLDEENALSLTPLGWSRGELLYLMASSTDTSLYTIKHGRRRFIGILMPQVVTSALLSAGGRYVAYGVPTGCDSCTVDLYDLDHGTVWTGPTGMPNELAMTWTRDGSTLVVSMPRRLALLTPASSSFAFVPAPLGLPDLSRHSVSASVSRSSVTLLDLVTGRTYRSGR